MAMTAISDPVCVVFEHVVCKFGFGWFGTVQHDSETILDTSGIIQMFCQISAS
jgi:hypothetical protein